MLFYHRALLLVGLVSLHVAAGAAQPKTLHVFQVTSGYQYNASVPNGNDSHASFGLAFHQGKLALVWPDNSKLVSSPDAAPARVPNAVFASVRVKSPKEVVVGKNIVVSKSQNATQLDPEIVMDPFNTDRISVLTDNRIPHGPQRGSHGWTFASSNDGGKSWKTNSAMKGNAYKDNAKAPLPRSQFEIGDHALRSDRFGNIFLAYEASDAPNRKGLSGLREYPEFMYLAVSVDHGESFKLLQTFDPREMGPTHSYYNWPELAVGDDQVAIGATNYSGLGGKPVSAEIFIFPVEGLGKIGTSRRVSNPNGPTSGMGVASMAFSPNGGLLVANTANAALEASIQSSDVIFTSFLPRGAQEFPSDSKYQMFRNVGVGVEAYYPVQPNRGTYVIPRVAYAYHEHHRGRVYMTYVDNPHVAGWPDAKMRNDYGKKCPHFPDMVAKDSTCDPGWADTNIYIAYSDDDGKHWSEPYAIPKKNSNTRYMPQLAIDQSTGNVAVAWFDSVNDPDGIKVQVFATVVPADFFD